MSWIKSKLGRRSYERLKFQDQDSEIEVPIKSSDRGRFSLWMTALNVLVASMTVAVVLLHEINHKPLISAANQCDCSRTAIDPRYKNSHMNPDLKRVSGYSPLFDEVDLTPQPTVLNGAFHDNKTIYMQDPSPEVDEAWDMFAEDIFLTSWTNVRDSGRSLSKSIHFPPDSHGSPGKYVATWDFVHQIHCLNWLRQAANWEYYYEGKVPTENFVLHQKHCINMLLQNLMCHADVDIITFEWMEGHDERVKLDEEGSIHAGKVRQDALPTANFNVHKMCRNFTALVEWAKKNKEKDSAETRRKLKVPENVQLGKFDDL